MLFCLSLVKCSWFTENRLLPGARRGLLELPRISPARLRDLDVN